ncbi:hypothetical protein FRC01_006055 [Tulasnella sp. 417]|nr:hypothetical protein FRC01_006055 [Tulasnella sp. 417]
MKKLTADLAGELVGEVVVEVAGKVAGELVGKEPRPESGLALALNAALNPKVNRVRHSIEDTQDRVLDKALDDALGRVLDRALDEALAEVLHPAPRVVKDPAQRLAVESSILRVLLWTRKKSSGTQLGRSDKRKIFIASCRLWAPLETRVELAIHRVVRGIRGEQLTFDDDNRDKLLTPDDLNGIVEFVEDLQKDWEKSEFIARNADVGINRLYVHLNRRVDWNYELYDLREKRTYCVRSAGIGIGMI